MTTQPRKAVIFDLDGVLVDSYPAHFESWQILLAPLGLAMSDAQFAATFGQTNREIITGLWGPNRFSAEEISAIGHRKEELYRQILAQRFPAMPGGRELVGALCEAGFAVAIGSSAPPENVALTLDHLDNREAFGAVVTGADVRRGKPDPAVFLTAAERLGVPPADCVVVEDAPVGVAAAKAAGMVSIALVSTGRTRAAVAEADLVVDSLDELSPEGIGRLIAERSNGGAVT
ncbi:MAG: HAD family hydrolase [Pirellulales bacterium]